MPPSILLVDDHPGFRAGLAFILRGLDAGLVLREAPSIRRALEDIDSHGAPDLIIYDWKLGEGGRVAGLTALMGRLQQVPVVVLSASEKEEVRMIALQAGARAYLSKAAEAQQICAVIGDVLAHSVAPAHPDRPPGETAPLLSARRLEVLLRLAEGRRNKEIAELLGLAEPTVRDHVSAILDVLGARNRTEAVAIATRHGLLPGR